MIQDVNADSIWVTNTMPNFSNDVYGQSSTVAALLIQGGFTSLLLGVEQDAILLSAARKLPFDE